MRALGVALVFLLAAACSSGGKAASTTTTTAAPATTVTQPTVPAHHFGSPEEVMRYLFLQWQAGDRAAAEASATPDAVTTLFSKPVGGNQFRGCSHPNDQSLGSDCTYQYGNGLLEIHVTFANGNWQATGVQFLT